MTKVWPRRNPGHGGELEIAQMAELRGARLRDPATIQIRAITR